MTMTKMQLLAAMSMLSVSGLLIAADNTVNSSATVNTSGITVPADTKINNTQIFRASKLIGQDVRNAQGQKLGDIYDLVLDLDRGQVAYAVLHFGGFWDFGGKLFAVPFQTVQVAPNMDHVVINESKERFQNAPGFDKNNWPSMGDYSFNQQVYSYYNQPAYWHGDYTGRAGTGGAEGMAGVTTSTTSGHHEATVNTPAGSASVTTSTTTGHVMASDMNSKKTAWMHKASQLVGMNVYNAQNESLGEVQDLAIDAKNGKIAYAVLSYGGWFGTGYGDKYFAVPFNALKIDANKKQFVLNMDKNRLKNAPGFDKNHWPNMADPSFGENVYGHYGTTPYWKSESNVNIRSDTTGATIHTSTTTNP